MGKHHEVVTLHLTGPFASRGNSVCHKEGGATVALTYADLEESSEPTGRPATLLALFRLVFFPRRAHDSVLSRTATL